MGKRINLKTKQFGAWFVLDQEPIQRKDIKSRILYWKCRCECGTVKYVDGHHLRDGSSKCCGCIGDKNTSIRALGNNYGHIHGLHKHPIRSIWKAMKHRCYNKNNKYYYRYGERGISVCKEWNDSFLIFYDWALNNGWVKGLSIDRRDNDGNYSPKNCHWITRSENSSKNCVWGKYDRKGRGKKRIQTTV